MTDLHWRYHVAARCGDYEYIVSESTRHPGTYQLRVADGQTNATLHVANTFRTVNAALDAAAVWHKAHEKVKA